MKLDPTFNYAQFDDIPIGNTISPSQASLLEAEIFDEEIL